MLFVMKGNNTMTKEKFVAALGHPRKKELAGILFTSSNPLEDAMSAGFNDVIVKEMARSIQRDVVGMENFSLNKVNQVASETETTVDASHVVPQNVPEANVTDASTTVDNQPTDAPTNEPETPTIQVADQVDQNVAVSGDIQNESVSTPNSEEGAPNQEVPRA